MKKFMRYISMILIVSFITTSAGFAETNKTQEISISYAGSELRFTAAEGVPYIDDTNHMQVPIAILEMLNITGQTQLKDRQYIPMRSVMESLGASVTWDGVRLNADIVFDVVPAELTVHFIDVGQGDSIFIDYGKFEMLIDAGGNKAGNTVAEYIKPYVDGALDLVIATHVHEDHIGGMDRILAAYEVTTLIDSGDTWDTKSYEDYYKAAIAEPDCNYMQDEDMTISFPGGLSIEILDIVDGDESVNNNSVIIQLTYNQVKVLLMGDAENKTELAGLSRFSDVNVLKVGHHGSNTATSPEFLNVVRPEKAVVSASLNNKFGHPHKKLLQRLMATGTETYGTFQAGTIKLVSDGNTYEMQALSGNLTALTEKDAGVIQMTTTDLRSDAESKYTGNSKTMVYHVSSCTYVKKIIEGEMVYFSTRDEAEEFGYAPCKLCSLIQDVMNAVY